MVRGAPSGGGRGRGRGSGARAPASSRSAAARAGNEAAAPQAAPEASMSAVPPSATPISVSSTPTASAASTPQPATAQPSSTRGASRPVGAALTGRLRPRNVRRNEEQRDLLAQQEAKKDSERAAEERRMRGRTRFRGRRARGNQFGPRMAHNTGPSSIFQGQGLRGSSSSRGGGFGGGFGGGAGGFRGRSGRGGRAGHKFEEGDAPWEEMRINTDKLGMSTAADDEDAEDERAVLAVHSQPGPRPLGINRRDEKERQMVIITTAEVEAQQGIAEEDSLFVGESPGSPTPVEAPQDDGKVWHAAPEDITQIKTEEGELRSVNPDVPTIDFDSNRKVPLPERDSEAESKDSIPGIKPKKLSAFSLEDEEEWEEESIQYILRTLAATSLQDPAKVAEGEEPEPSELSEPQPFLCKFGPIMPPLRPKARPEPLIKDEPSDDAIMLDQVAPVDLTRGGGGDDEEDTDPFKHGGYIGKLLVRKSGKVELDYGGIKYNMRRGIKSSGVTSYLVVEEEDVKPGSEEQYAGRAVAMGTLLGKFNFGPVWEEQKEWVVSEEDLRVPEDDVAPQA